MKKFAIYSFSLIAGIVLAFSVTPDAKACPGDPGFMYYDNIGMTYCVDSPGCPPCFGQIPRFCRPSFD